MRTLLLKLKLIVLSVPFYPIYMIGEWYEHSDNGRKFNLKKETKAYWKDVLDYLKTK